MDVGACGPTLVTKPDYEKLSATSISITAPARFAAFTCKATKACAVCSGNGSRLSKTWARTTLSISNTGGTDHLAFDAIGLPGFQFIQDEIEYDTRTHHSNQDVFDRIQADDMKQAATIMAAFVYHTAMRDEKLPRSRRRVHGKGLRRWCRPPVKTYCVNIAAQVDFRGWFSVGA